MVRGGDMRLGAFSAALVLGCGATQAVKAHHGWSLYQSSISFEGTVHEINFGNPHDQLVVVDEAGRSWSVLLAPPTRNRRAGFDASAIQVDEVVTLHGERHYREDVLEVKTERIERDGKEIYRYLGR